MAQRVTVRLDEAAVGTRFDRAVVDALHAAGHACTRSALVRSFASGGVVADGRRLKPGRVVEHAMEVRVDLPEPEPLTAEPEAMELHVVYEDDDLLVVDKAAGVVVHPGPGHPRGTLVSGVLHHLGARADALPVLPGNSAVRPGVVHRIDRETSGLIVFAKNAAAQETLAAQFRAHTIERVYFAVLAGSVADDRQRVETGHGRDPADRRRFSPQGDVRRAATDIAVQERFGLATSVECRLETGRTHQIRMHARHIGHPVVCDAIYGGTQTALAEVTKGLDRHALHAATLGFSRPGGAGHLLLEAPLPPDLIDLLARLRDASAA